MGEGHLYTFEFNEGRVENAKKLFDITGVSNNVDVIHRDVYKYGFK
jgi:predicted O-methyltransferase YrrM